MVVLWFVWRFLPKNDGPPVTQLALTFQWLQVTIGIFYFAVTGRRISEMDSDYRPVVLMGQGCILALTIGLRLGSLAVRTQPEVFPRLPTLPIGWSGLALLYFGSAVLTGSLQVIAWQYSGLTQGIFALALLRLCVLFLVFRRLCSPIQRFKWFAAVLAVEVAFGFTGYFAGFREPLLLALLAVLEVFDSRKWSHTGSSRGPGGGGRFLWFPLAGDPNRVSQRY